MNEIYKFTCGCKFRVKFKSIDFIEFEAIFFWNLQIYRKIEFYLQAM